MSRLSYYCRPEVSFDPSNREHRLWFHQFVVNHTWGKCPVRFIVPDEDGDLITLCQRKLIDYYVTKEFGRSRVRKAGAPRNGVVRVEKERAAVV